MTTTICVITGNDAEVIETVENERMPYRITAKCSECGNTWTRIKREGDNK